MGNSVKFWTALIMAVMLSSCKTETQEDKKNDQPAQPEKAKPSISLIETPAFSSDSAYAFIQKQVDFGPRVPNSEAHKACAKWLENKLASYGLKTNVQETTVKSYNQIDLEIYNIMGQLNPEAENRILFCAHWDTRPYADRGNKNKSQPIDGANDGASGVAVLLEMARVLSQDSNFSDLGVDIVFFDAEDYGKPQQSMIGSSMSSWCLGSQYWAQNLPIAGYNPKYGILLDMVGAADAVFPRDGVSLYYAGDVVDFVWTVAQKMGYGNYFIDARGPELTDDHVPLNQIAKIPTIDVIHYDLGRMDFGAFHHTHDDTMDIIDKTTLKAVGEVMTQVVYQERTKASPKS